VKEFDHDLAGGVVIFDRAIGFGNGDRSPEFVEAA
jgi:hypothetical protein